MNQFESMRGSDLAYWNFLHKILQPVYSIQLMERRRESSTNILQFFSSIETLGLLTFRL